jgi:hypothetical protein
MKVSTIKISIDAIAKRHGRATPELIVEEARDPGHALHSQFDWDDQSAAHQHRLAVARALLRKIEYIAHDVVGRPVVAVGYVHEPGVPGQSYVPLSEVARNKKQSEALLMQELAACESHIRRAQRIADVLHLRDRLDSLLVECIETKEKVEEAMVKKSKAKAPRGRPRRGTGPSHASV